MCWTSKYKPKLKVAKDNIPVTKIVKIIPKLDIIQAYFIDFFQYSIGEVYNSKLEFPILSKDIILNDVWEINEGIHSYKSSSKIEKISERSYYALQIRDAKKNLLQGYGPIFNNSCDMIGIMSCIIPKDSKYYENEHGEIVSDTIKPIYCYKI